MNKYIVLIEEIPLDGLESLSRLEKLSKLRLYYKEKASSLLNYLRSLHVEGDIKIANENTVFNTLFLESEGDIEEDIRNAPGVEQVAADQEESIELLY